MNIEPHEVWSTIQAIKQFSPLIHNITNYVVMEQTANSLLAIGASPVMAHALEEVEAMAMNADSLILNMGTLSPLWIKGMMLALKAANRKKIPIVFDPVGTGATPYRTLTAHSLLNHGVVTVIRGNASEVASLCGNPPTIKGVNSCLSSIHHIETAKALALERKCIVAMSGATDVVTDGRTVYLVHNGHSLMEKVTGMGCTATALMGAFLASHQDPLRASVCTMSVMGIAGELAAKQSFGPGSFKASFIDFLHLLSLNDIQQHLRLEFL